MPKTLESLWEKRSISGTNTMYADDTSYLVNIKMVKSNSHIKNEKNQSSYASQHSIHLDSFQFIICDNNGT